MILVRHAKQGLPGLSDCPVFMIAHFFECRCSNADHSCQILDHLVQELHRASPAEAKFRKLSN